MRLIRPLIRLGGPVGINIGYRGVSGSIRTKIGTYNTKRGCFARFFSFLALASAAVWVVEKIYA